MMRSLHFDEKMSHTMNMKISACFYWNMKIATHDQFSFTSKHNTMHSHIRLIATCIEFCVLKLFNFLFVDVLFRFFFISFYLK